MDMMTEIGTTDRAEQWLADAQIQKRAIMGFGYRVYKNSDSRVPTMRAALGEIAAPRDDLNLLDLYETPARAMYQAKGLHPNLDYPAGPAYHLIGFDTPTVTPIFAIACLPGWTAHITEPASASSLIRPLAAYTGPTKRMCLSWMTPPSQQRPIASWRYLGIGPGSSRIFGRSCIAPIRAFVRFVVFWLGGRTPYCDRLPIAGWSAVTHVELDQNFCSVITSSLTTAPVGLSRFERWCTLGRRP
jgi:hypothetical protein